MVDVGHISAAQFVPGTLSECGVAPTSWADSWTISEYPGKRGLGKAAKYTLEIALLADGVKPDQLYQMLATPQGVSRAFCQARPLPVSRRRRRCSPRRFLMGRCIAMR